MKFFTLFYLIFFCSISIPIFGMSVPQPNEQKKIVHYAIRAENNALIIHGNNKIKKISFDAPISALTSVKNAPYVLVGLKNGTVILHNIKNKKHSICLPSVHSVEITTVYADESNFFTADAGGINYVWHNIWSNTLYGQKIRTEFPVIDCEGTEDYFALQHTKRRIEYPKISLLERSRLKEGIVTSETYYGTLKGLSDNTLFIEQDRTVFALPLSKKEPPPHVQ